MTEDDDEGRIIVLCKEVRLRILFIHGRLLEKVQIKLYLVRDTRVESNFIILVQVENQKWIKPQKRTSRKA